MDDLVAQGCTPFALADECTLEHAQGLMRVFAELHATFKDSPRFATDLSFVKPMTQRSGAAVLRLTMRKVRRFFLETPDERPVPTAVTRLLGTVQAHDKALYRSWERGPLTLLHGDSHLGNTYALPDGRAGLLDWQVVWRGRGLREIAYFLGGGVPTELRRRTSRTCCGSTWRASRSTGSRRRRSTTPGGTTGSSCSTPGTAAASA